ncbi:unnamed protein product [Arctogadus glacialis]
MMMLIMDCARSVDTEGALCIPTPCGGTPPCIITTYSFPRSFPVIVSQLPTPLRAVPPPAPLRAVPPPAPLRAVPPPSPSAGRPPSQPLCGPSPLPPLCGPSPLPAPLRAAPPPAPLRAVPPPVRGSVGAGGGPPHRAHALS